jgi:hypothetical protein
MSGIEKYVCYIDNNKYYITNGMFLGNLLIKNKYGSLPHISCSEKDP